MILSAIGPLRGLRVMLLSDRMRQKLSTLTRLAPFMLYFLLQMILMFYAFAALGVSLLGTCSVCFSDIRSTDCQE